MTQTVSAAVATRDRSDQLVSWIRRQQDDIAMAAASHVKPSAIIRVTQGALRRDDKLLAAAIANPQSLLYALLDCARLGHEPDTDDYYLVPFGQEVTGIEGYKGIIERMFRAGGVTSVVAQVVRKTDRYAPRGENTPPLHEYDDFASAEERGPMRGAYAYAIFTSGHCSQVIRMGRAEIMEHKAASRGSNRSDSPWQQWEPSMWKKTVLRGLEPYVPTSNEFRTLNGAAPAGLGSVADRATDFTYLPPPPASVADSEIVDAEIVDDPPPSNGRAKQEAPKPAARTARRKTETGQGTDKSGTAQRATGSLSGSESAKAHQPPAASPDLPPEDQPGSASEDQLQSLHIILGGLGFKSEDREAKLRIAETITGRSLGGGPVTSDPSTKNLSFTEAGKLIRELDSFVNENGERDRAALIAHMAEREDYVRQETSDG